MKPLELDSLARSTVLGFGANFSTLIAILVFAVATKNSRCTRTTNRTEKIFLRFLPVTGACLSCAELVLLLKKKLNEDTLIYNEWLLQFSQLVIWVMIMILSKFGSVCSIFYSQILCFWWVIKVLLEVLRLKNIFHSLEACDCLKESFLISLDIIFGTYINVVRMKQKNPSKSLLEDPLLPTDKDIEEGNVRVLRDAESWGNLLMFRCIMSVMTHGVTKQLDFEDLLHLPSDMDPSLCHGKLLSCWHVQQNDCRKPSLLRAIGYAYGWPYFRLGLLKVFNDCIGFAGPLLLNKLIRYLERGSGHFDGYALAISLGLTSVFKSFLDTQYTFHLSKLKLKLRSSIMTLIYRKCLWVSLADRSSFGQGEIQTFMSVDADRTINLCNSLHDMWSLPLQIGVALYLLYTQVNFAFLSGLAITILLIPVNKWISELIATATGKMMTQKDESYSGLVNEKIGVVAATGRIRQTGELLTNIRTLKMYGWEYLFACWLKETRSLEVKHLATRKYLDAWCVFFWATTPTLFTLFTFGLFTLMGNQLDAATVFTCLALFNNLISPLNSFPWVINGLIDAFISARRLSRFLSCHELRLNTSNGLAGISEDMAICIHDATCAWPSHDKEEKDLILKDIKLIVPKGVFVAVIGEVGSGKTSLLNSLLGEILCVEGSILLSGSVAYVPQVPWILSGTIRENILFGKAFDPRRYSDTLKACTLDLDISFMIGGDLAHVGEKGHNLSGGQRARLALARAIYHDSDIYLLDDVLSAVDTYVGWRILHNAIQGPLMYQKTRVLCTHNFQAISSADIVVVLEKGHLKWVGNSRDLSSSIFSAMLASQNEFDSSSPAQSPDYTQAIIGGIKETCSLDECYEKPMNATEDTIESEERKEGSVEFIVYKNYAAFSGWVITVVIISSAVLMQASRNGNDLWLSYWVDKTSTKEQMTSHYLVVLCFFCVINSVLTLVRAFSFAFGGLRAAVRIHDTLLSKLINAPIRFFDETPGGRILNRFSSDLYAIDDSLPFILNILLANFVGLLGIAVVLSYVQVLFLLLLLPFWYIYSKLQLFYRSTSRELRRLDSVSRSPIYSSFTETIDGSSTIRAFNAEECFLTRFTEHVMLYQRTSYSETVASLWLSLRLQLLGASVVSFVALMAVIGSQGNLAISFGTPGLVGLALSYAAPLVSLLGSFLTSFTETEKEMVSVERALQYMDAPQEDTGGLKTLHQDWPFRGDIEFQNVSVRYSPSLPPALHGISFIVQGGTQVGVIGRTGAGKSSVLNALFRLVPICSGRILVDGLNISDLPVRDLRARLSIVPQSPFLFEGSLRANLDPLGVSEDTKIWGILEKCHIKTQVEEAGGLDIHVKESGASFSVGQRQLLCLARALLNSSKVLCLDECTANVDTQTASVLHGTIANECSGMTVITIAHRISTVLNMDKVLVLDRGALVEQGNPQVLLQDELSVFSGFARASTM